jgi:hypothetical protein
MDRPVHPLQKWLSENGLDYEQAAERCKRAGREVSSKYLEQIARGYYSPSYALAKFLSRALTKNKISVPQLKEFPYARTSGEAA